MKTFLNFLFRHKFISITLLLGYYLFVVLPHEAVGKFLARTLDVPLGRANYNLLVMALFAFAASVLLFWFIKLSKAIPRDVYLQNVRYLVICFVLLGLCLWTIFVINIEMIHVIQYAIMTLMTFALSKNYLESFFWSILLGALDEWYQYMILAPKTNHYFDLNDVVINSVGVCFGLVALRLLDFRETKSYPSVWHRPSIKAAITLTLALLLSFLIGIVSMTKNGDSKAIFVFMKERPAGFWSEIPRAGKFHIVRPLEALLILAIITWLFKDVGLKENSPDGNKI